ncbi:MAG: SGNH/GDSL hydrolase family protein [Clostridia bacterium]|nr:SGNH/GDSL hydrolase family protein [Clostridia bacterium]
MRIFKRFGLYVLSILLVVVLVSAAFMVPWLHTPTDAHDQALRGRLAGQIDTLIIGQSYAMNGIIPAVLDERLGTVTYNLSGSLMPIYGQAYMIEKELARNPVRHVLLEITPDTFTTDEHAAYGNGDSYIVGRLDSAAERLDYLVRCVQLEDWPNIYARMLLLSLRSAAYRLLGRAEMIDDANMGYNPQRAEDVSIDEDWARATHQAMSIFSDPLEANISRYEALLERCLAAGCEVTLVYTPVSHCKVWQLYDQDTFLQWARGLAAKHGVALFDFNLLKDRYTLFTDESSFSDDNHLSAEGAAVFSGVMADVLARHRAGEDVSSLFYESYREVIRDSVYWGRPTAE